MKGPTLGPGPTRWPPWHRVKLFAFMLKCTQMQRLRTRKT